MFPSHPKCSPGTPAVPVLFFMSAWLPPVEVALGTAVVGTGAPVPPGVEAEVAEEAPPPEAHPRGVPGDHSTVRVRGAAAVLQRIYSTTNYQKIHNLAFNDSPAL